MINILQTRLIHWKKQWVTLLFWLLFPILASLTVIYLTETIQEDSRVPIGMVMEENSPLADDLLESMKQTPLLQVHELSEEEALLQLERHDLDSVFIIQEGYEEQIRNGSRSKLVTSYQSDLSFAYTPVREMIISYVQQDTGRSKAAHTIKDLSENVNIEQQWTWNEIVATSKQIEANENLLHTTFSFADTPDITVNADITVWNTWGLWAIFSLLSTLLLFDWVIKDKKSALKPRFAFIRVSFKNFLMQNVLWYTILLFLFDFIALLIFHFLLAEPVNMALIGAVLSFRLTINLAALLLGLTMKKTYSFYGISFAGALITAITSGAILPVDGLTDRMPWLKYINPLEPLLLGKILNPWFFVFLLIIAIWYLRKEKADA
ncbi:ABC transporter permease [Virgibacillus ainsalahensis]